MKLLFVTGAPRTGTTLVEKMLCMHPQIELLSQPLPMLFVDIKAEFLSRHHVGATAHNHYPLNDMFLENYYDPESFITFLENLQITRELSRRVLDEMADYSGQYTKPRSALFFRCGKVPAELIDYVFSYCRRSCSKAGVELTGLKESFCEEFIPYFLKRGASVAHVLRDPRDSIASLLYGEGSRHGGLPRPLLFLIRQWRKSALIAMAYRRHARYSLLKYENVATEPNAQLDPVVRPLTYRPFHEQAFAGDLYGSDQGVWRSNSSHHPATTLSRASIGIHARLMSSDVRRFIEACCYFEMVALGYEPELHRTDLRNALFGHHDNSPLVRPGLADYQWSAARKQEELDRIKALETGVYRAELFISREAFEVLNRGQVVP